MRQAYSKEIEYSVMELYISGDNFQEISTQVGVSVGYVSSVKEKYEEKLGKGDLDATHEFTKKLRKLGISPQQALIGARTFSLLEENKLKSEELELFLKKVSKIMQEKDFELSTIIDAYEKVLILQSRLKVSLEHLPTEYESLSNKVIKLQKEISELVSTKKIAEDELNDTIKNCKVVKDDLGQFQAIKNRLEKHDIDFKNLSKIENIFSRAADAGFDFDRIKKHLEKEEKYESQKAQLEDKIRELSAREANLKAKIDDISMKISTNEKLLKELQQLNRLEISADDLTEFGKKLYQVSKSQGVSIKQSFHKFVKNLINYDKLLGYEPELEKIENEIQKKILEREKGYRNQIGTTYPLLDESNFSFYREDAYSIEYYLLDAKAICKAAKADDPSLVDNIKNRIKSELAKPITDQMRPKDLLKLIWSDNGFGPYNDSETPKKIAGNTTKDYLLQFPEIVQIIDKINS